MDSVVSELAPIKKSGVAARQRTELELRRIEDVSRFHYFLVFCGFFLKKNENHQSAHGGSFSVLGVTRGRALWLRGSGEMRVRSLFPPTAPQASKSICHRRGSAGPR